MFGLQLRQVVGVNAIHLHSRQSGSRIPTAQEQVIHFGLWNLRIPLTVRGKRLRASGTGLEA
jgi:hypothetical protein